MSYIFSIIFLQITLVAGHKLYYHILLLFCTLSNWGLHRLIKYEFWINERLPAPQRIWVPIKKSICTINISLLLIQESDAAHFQVQGELILRRSLALNADYNVIYITVCSQIILLQCLFFYNLNSCQYLQIKCYQILQIWLITTIKIIQQSQSCWIIEGGILFENISLLNKALNE